MENTVVNIHQEVVDGCIAGDRAAQYRFYKLYAKAMLHICYRMLRDEEAAQDVCQEAFISAFSNFQSYKGDASVGSWLKRIVVNKALDFLRKKKDFIIALNDNEHDRVEEEEGSCEDTQASVQVVKEAIDALPAGYRTVLTLYLFEGYDHKEIAEILNISESTSKTQYNRAKAKLKEQLKHLRHEAHG
ncbi:RNA polymerase sigma factor [Cytophagales bacterium LB-30]|uniref:RNA polymerase sigma factor n=1 Tax=Shiella aurantiaca TaxID=3058365 RepID=A0ABT8F482_9BACT|nr:RNA polymerase sigma factor [Shiella aurantiaca]MDN4165267.1 RNA polymerase sigma factor [Shiella aurantiaca]